MAQFKVGDRVRSVADGEEGTITSEDNALTVDVKWDDNPSQSYRSYKENIELVEEQPNRTYYEGATPPNAEERARVRALLKKSTPVDPDHYKFPGGAEVIHISQWLTANAAQALQYVARSSRIDGKNKGDASEDIRKAITFLEFELNRLESE